MDSYITCIETHEDPETAEEFTPSHYQSIETEGSTHTDDENNIPRAHVDGYDEMYPMTEQTVPLPFNLFLSKVARSISNEDLEQIKFIFRVYYGEDEPLPSSGYDALNILMRKNEIRSNNVLFLQVLCAAIGNHRTIDDVYRWAESLDDVIHFDQPVKCSYNWKFSGPVHIKGAKLEQYTLEDIEAMRGHARTMWSTFVRTLNKPSNKSKDQNTSAGLNQVQSITRNLSEELNVHLQEIIGLDRAENTVPKQYAVEDLHRFTEQNKEILNLKKEVEEHKDSVKALTIENSRLLETVRQLEGYNNLKDEETERIKAQLSGKEKEMISLKESLESRKQDGEQLTSRLRKANDDMLNKEKEFQKLNATHLDLSKKHGILKLNEDSLMGRIAELQTIVEMKEASLLNERNAKMRAELHRKLQFISEHSLTVRKACGIFDPGSIPIPVCSSERFKHTFTYKVVRLFPQLIEGSNNQTLIPIDTMTGNV